MSEIEKSSHKKQCDQMHRAKYCVCCMVECATCEHVHGAQKEHVLPKAAGPGPAASTGRCS